MDVIRVVQGDELPVVTLTLTNHETGGAIDLSGASTTVVVKFRKGGTTTVLSTIATTKVGDGSGGQVTFDFSGGVLDVDPGMYEGEVEIDFNGSVQTGYGLLRFRVRQQF